MGLHELVTLMEEHCARLRADRMNPALVVDELRPFTQRIWRNFSVAERQDFSAFPHPMERRAPPHPAGRRRQIETAQKEDGFVFSREGFVKCGATATGSEVTIDPGDGLPPHELVVGLLVNCTGPRESMNDAPETASSGT